jgi:hypothetical protein
MRHGIALSKAVLVFGKTEIVGKLIYLICSVVRDNKQALHVNWLHFRNPICASDSIVSAVVPVPIFGLCWEFKSC